MKSNRFWIILFGVIILVSITVTLLLFTGQASKSYALIYKNGTLTDTVNLLAITENHTIVVQDSIDPQGVMHGFNQIDIEHGRIRVSNADCPSGACVRRGWMSGGRIPIVCLPNRLIVMFDGVDTKDDVDAVVG